MNETLPAEGCLCENAVMWPFRRKSQLSYPSVPAWMKGERIPADFVNIADDAERDRVIRQFGELRQHLFGEHVRTLPPVERSLLSANRHASQSHDRTKEAERYAERLREHLGGLPFIKAVGLGAYHGDRLVLVVEISPEARQAEVESHIPAFFFGFEVRTETGTGQS
jgi:hypothetical protein